MRAGPDRARLHACAQDLKARTRVFVPRSALLMGVMDEERVLQYGEVGRACALHAGAVGQTLRKSQARTERMHARAC